MVSCECSNVHEPKRIVLTGGPGAGKTAVLELIRHAFCEHVTVLPEAASVLFGGGFPRGNHLVRRKAAQRAIYYVVQRELELSATAVQPAIILCDRGTIDGIAYWPGPDDLWTSVESDLATELAHYDAVIHLRTPPASAYNHDNPLRLESVAEAQSIDERIADAWSAHPHRSIIEPEQDFMSKAARALDALRGQLPACCRTYVLPACHGHNATGIAPDRSMRSSRLTKARSAISCAPSP
jgi:predicted ATPase